jgi:hypothetical protein
MAQGRRGSRLERLESGEKMRNETLKAKASLNQMFIKRLVSSNDVVLVFKIPKQRHLLVGL